MGGVICPKHELRPESAASIQNQCGANGVNTRLSSGETCDIKSFCNDRLLTSRWFRLATARRICSRRCSEMAAENFELNVPEHITFLNGYMDAVGRILTSDTELWALTARDAKECLEGNVVLGVAIHARSALTDWSKEFGSLVDGLLGMDQRSRLGFYLIEYICWLKEFTKNAECLGSIAIPLAVRGRRSVRLYTCCRLKETTEPCYSSNIWLRRITIGCNRSGAKTRLPVEPLRSVLRIQCRWNLRELRALTSLRNTCLIREQRSGSSLSMSSIH